MNTICIESICKKFTIQGSHTPLLEGVTLSIEKGQQFAIVGLSGSGKSTLLHLIGGLVKPTSGSIHWGEHDIWTLSPKMRSTLRNHYIGIVYQSHNLMEEFSALENTAFPLMIRGHTKKEALEQAKEWLDMVGLYHRAHHAPKQLSGGERQRVAIARALSALPHCLLADEPTGNLDEKTEQNIFSLLQKLSEEHKIALAIVTHNSRLAAQFPLCYRLTQGTLESTHFPS